MEMELIKERADLENIDTAVFQEILDMTSEELNGEIADIK